MQSGNPRSSQARTDVGPNSGPSGEDTCSGALQVAIGHRYECRPIDQSCHLGDLLVATTDLRPLVSPQALVDCVDLAEVGKYAAGLEEDGHLVGEDGAVPDLDYRQCAALEAAGRPEDQQLAALG